MTETGNVLNLVIFKNNDNTAKVYDKKIQQPCFIFIHDVFQLSINHGPVALLEHKPKKKHKNIFSQQVQDQQRTWKHGNTIK